MTIARPDLTTLRTRIAADLSARILGGAPLLRHSNLGIIADVFAGQAHAQHGHWQWLERQVLPDTTVYNLERWAEIFGLSRVPASYASGQFSLTGTDGASLPSGAVIRRGDGVEYVVTTGATIAAGVATVEARAVLAGSDGNAPDLYPVRLGSANVGIAAEVLASGEISGGADAESDDALRARLLSRMRQPPQGGSKNDYAQWALTVPGVSRVWVSPEEMGIGTVSIRFMMDDARAAFSGAPQGTDSPAATGDQLAVFEYIEAVRPVTAEVFVLAPTLVPVPVEISNLTPDTPEVRAAISESLKLMFFNIAAPGVSIPVSKIWEAISTATGESSHILTLPAADVAFGVGEIGVLGVVTYA